MKYWSGSARKPKLEKLYVFLYRVYRFTRERVKNAHLIYGQDLKKRNNLNCWNFEVEMLMNSYRCPKYPPLPDPCHLVQDPNNICCKIPQCTFPGQVTSMSGQGKITTPAPVQTTAKPYIPVTQAQSIYLHIILSYIILWLFTVKLPLQFIKKYFFNIQRKSCVIHICWSFLWLIK